MLDIMWVALFIGGLTCIWIYMYMYRHWTKFSKLPPGPKGWPLVGNAFQQDSIRPHITWSKWSEKYGEVMTINIFGTPFVLCNSSQAIWEMLVSKSNDFAGRPSIYTWKHLTHANIIAGDFEPHWAYRKKVFITSVKMYGDGLKHLENIMVDIIHDLKEDFLNTKQLPFDLLKPMQLALCNTLSLLLLGDKFEHGDPDFLKLLDYIAKGDEIYSPSLPFFLVESFPWLHHLPLPYCRLIDQYVNGFVKDWIPRMMQKRMVHYDEDNPDCILDAFIKQQKNENKTIQEYSLTNRHIIDMCQDFFGAGMLTSTTAMYTMIAILAVRTDIQEKVQAEIDMVLGGRCPNLEDKGAMPYFQALLEEVLRYTVITNGVPHSAKVDSSICGHFIPKDTRILANVWHLCHDPKLWEDPWTFNPDRFLDENGIFVPADHPARKNVLVFGAGRRVCAGEQLARNRIFLIATSLLQSFTLKPADPMPQQDPRKFAPGVIFKPESYKIRAVPRD